MRRFCLAAFRSVDGRSLARALVCLLVLSGCLGALHAGSMTALASDGVVVCRANGGALVDGSVPLTPANRDYCFCCVLGCTAAIAGIAAGAVEQPEFDRPTETTAKPNHVFVAVAAVRPTLAGPRGPPFLV
jgi:hypothetical protein